MSQRTRAGNHWTVNECLQLQREFELLNLSIDEIADRHKRTPSAIMNKLDREGLADYNVLYTNYYDLNSQIPTYRTNKYEDEEEDDETIQFEDNLEDQEYIPDEEEEDDADDEEEEEDDTYDHLENIDDIKKHVIRLEKSVIALTEMIMMQTKNSKSLFSLFA